MLSFLLIYLCTFYFQTQALNSGSQIILRPCKATDSHFKQCWLQKIEDLRLDLLKGIPDLSLPPIDPLLIRKLTVGKRKSAVASYQAQFHNIVYTGARYFQVLDANIDYDSLVLKLKIILPSVHMATSYNVDGDVLGFRLLGDGSGEASISNLILDLVLDGEHYTKNGLEYIRWKEGSKEITYENARFQIYDIIKDPTEMSLFNYVFNQNAEALRGTLTSFLDRTLGNFIIEAINRVQDTFSKNSLYPIY